jgi:putative membrane protein
MKRQIPLMTSIAFALATVMAQAQAPAPRPAPSPKTTTQGEEQGKTAAVPSDQEFARKVAAGGIAEVELAKMAQQKASAEEVKSLASRLETDHMKANDELKQLASKKGWTLPTTPTADQTAKKDKLEKLSGTAFDKAYVDLMVTNHKNNIPNFQRVASHGSDSDLKDFASMVLPTLKEHLDLAQKAQKNLAGQHPNSSTGYSSKTGSNK